MSEQETPYPTRMPHELREALEAMAANNNISLHAEIIDILNKAVEGFEKIETKQQALNALRIQNEIINAITRKQPAIYDFISNCKN